MTTLTGADFLDALIAIHAAESPLAQKVSKMRAVLQRACKTMTAGESVQFSNLFSRLNYVCRKTGLDGPKTFAINAFRIAANRVLHQGFVPTPEDYSQSLKAVCEAIGYFFKVEIPEILVSFFPENPTPKPARRSARKHERIRVQVTHWDSTFIYALDEDHPSEAPVKIFPDTDGENVAFRETVSQLWKGCQLNLIDVRVADDGTYHPELLILEPDYLLDVSALAECRKEHSRHPLNFLRSRLEPVLVNRHILLGNIANLFLDEIIHETPDAPVLFADAMKKAFKASPFEFATCAEIDKAFFDDAQAQFINIQTIVRKVFPQTGIDRESALLEPHFICEQLGVQGRLDLLQLQPEKGRNVVIELKSGKAPWPENNHSLIGVNHQSQAFLYQIMIQKMLGVPFRDLSTFICYSKYTDAKANLRLSAPSMAAIKEILALRNSIVANEHGVAADPTENVAQALLDGIYPHNLLTHAGTANAPFLQKYIIPQIEQFRAPLENASALELAYFHAFYAFVAREHYLSKAGEPDADSTRGISSLWLASTDEKAEAGEILTGLTILENRTESDDPFLRLRIPEYGPEFLPAFRTGDIVMLYERNNDGENVTNRQVFKGAVAQISPTEITIRVRYKQRNPAVLPQGSRYAIEPDFLDATYLAQYRGLYSFLQASQERKDLLLSQRAPVVDAYAEVTCTCETPEIARIVAKAKRAKDYFLLLGPPGTGKTSLALKALVEEFYQNPETNILLLSYTNRAVDEICDALNTVAGSPNYVRIGPELSCEPKHRHRLLDRVIGHCNKRDEVRAVIEKHRIFVGTVASLSGKTDLFRLKQFGVAIVDEASQILEPMLLGLLSAKSVRGGNAIEKFILIGDHKQLPAVVLQSSEISAVQNPQLRQIGLTDRRESLFERLFRKHQSETASPHWEMLCHHGRMHPEIAFFPNQFFYNNRLKAVPTPHQQAALPYRSWNSGNPVQQLVATQRLAFLPSAKNSDDKTAKTNTNEARNVVRLIQELWDLCRQNNLELVADEPLPTDPEKFRKISVGIITPYRAQIALLRREIHKLGIESLYDLTIDTVERFQGSQRDVILYSFCVNEPYQLELLANVVEDEGQQVDRKLNVAITRAKKQLFVTGNPALLQKNPIYKSFLDCIREKGCIMEAGTEDYSGEDFRKISASAELLCPVEALG